MAFELGLFSSFRFSSFDLIVSHLQYANDYHILTEASIENIWMVKYMHRSFTLASGLHVNFSKSYFICVNVDPDFLELAKDFLHYRLGDFPFNYISLPVGDNPYSESFSDPFIIKFSRRLIT